MLNSWSEGRGEAFKLRDEKTMGRSERTRGGRTNVVRKEKEEKKI